MIRIIRKYIAQRKLEADVRQRRALIGNPYAKRRAAALRGLGR
jgi:hypothetical protein